MRDVVFKNSLIITLCLLVLPSTLWAGGYYKSQMKDGTVMFSDVRPGTAARSYKYIGARLKRGKATASCAGMNESRLEERASTLAEKFIRYGHEFGVDPKLVKAIARVESCFHVEAVSSAGARGVMQLMPATAGDYGVYDLFNADKNIRTGVMYFAEMHKKFDFNARLALAAYNAGPGAVSHYNGVPPYPETQKYVEKVLKRYRAYSLSAQN